MLHAYADEHGAVDELKLARVLRQFLDCVLAGRPTDAVSGVAPSERIPS